MLDPNDRSVYLEDLRPPVGYTLDLALATTYSLDLLSLLMVPMAMVFCDCVSQEEALSRPMALVEAIRRASGRVMVFCQRGRISVPRTHTKLYSFLEPMVIEARSASARGAFHPKIWLLRFTSESAPVRYRLVCLSRNMTTHRLWDVSACIEGDVDMNRRNGYSRNGPLRDFVKALRTFAVTQPRQHVLDQLELMADEVGRVKLWNRPADFDDVEFVPIGISNHRRMAVASDRTRMLAVSPFISGSTADEILGYGKYNILISTPEALNELDDRAVADLGKYCYLYTMMDGCETCGMEEGSQGGLHAKLYIIEKGSNVELLVGSANLTSAAFAGHNVEFMLKLIGKRRKVGIDQLLGKYDSSSTFRRMLQPYDCGRSRPAADSVREELDRILDDARRAFSEAMLALKVVRKCDRQYTIRLQSHSVFRLDSSIQCACYPITANRNMVVNARPLSCGQSISFCGLDVASFTTFVAFELSAVKESASQSVSFVLNIPADLVPPERDAAVLRNLISDTDSFMRYLMMMLYDDTEAAAADMAGYSGSRGFQPGSEGALRCSNRAGFPLLEELTRALSRSPEKIERIDSAMRDLQRAADCESFIPDGFTELWKVFHEAASAEVDR